MQDDLLYVYATAAVIVGLLVYKVATRRFDPFEPIWLFLVGYAHVYVIQAISVNEWALAIRGVDVVTAANQRALWALVWFLLVYYFGPGRLAPRMLPGPPRGWSLPAVAALSPLLFAWGVYCAAAVIMQGQGDDSTVSAELTIFRSFPFVMIVAGIMLLVTGRQPAAPSPTALALGIAVVLIYVAIWMFNGKRSHSLIGVLSAVCAYYITRRSRPSWPVLMSTAFAGALVVAVAIGWRNNPKYERSVTGFIEYLGDFRVTSILKSLNIEDEEEPEAEDARVDLSIPKSHETIEYGGFLLMIDTLPEKSDYDYGANYLRIFSTFVPRPLWPDKPLYGREQWIQAWQAGSELKREEDFTGPAIGILGATQLNGGSVGTLVVLFFVASFLRAAYGYFSRYDTVPCVQMWWALWYFNAWFMVVGDDPATWFYYNWGFACMPSLVIIWLVNIFAPAPGTVQAGRSNPSTITLTVARA
ncbi:MAG: hypothetical protein U0794_17825 [Isosphaeraceae bacterium]